jgi:hypothetical protein
VGAAVGPEIEQQGLDLGLIDAFMKKRIETGSMLCALADPGGW